MADGERAPTFGLVAGEASGDNLGGPLIRALAARAPAARFAGIAGPRMSEAGCEAWYPSDALAVMGLAEILRHLPRLLRLRRDLLERLVAAAPDAFIGIDSPEFNLRVARALKERGIPTVQYVSPQVWAWRQGRVHSIGQAVDLILCVLPFETAFYESHAVRAVFVGHPLADRVPLVSDPRPARAALGLPASGPVVAVLPGSPEEAITRSPPCGMRSFGHTDECSLWIVTVVDSDLGDIGSIQMDLAYVGAYVQHGDSCHRTRQLFASSEFGLERITTELTPGGKRTDEEQMHEKECPHPRRGSR